MNMTDTFDLAEMDAIFSSGKSLSPSKVSDLIRIVNTTDFRNNAIILKKRSTK